MAAPDPRELEQFMAAIRAVESGGNYGAIGPQTKYGRPTGAYQFLDSTWGGYGGYRRAVDAPPPVQDERARQLMSAYYAEFGRWDLVAVAWHGGPGAARKAAADPSYTSRIGDVNIRTNEYVNRVMGHFTGGGGSGGQFTQAQFYGGAGVPAGDSGVGRKYRVPSDAVVMETIFGVRLIVFDLDGIRIQYTVDDTVDVSGLPVVPFKGTDGPWVNGGDAAELDTIATDYGSMRAYWNHMLDLYIADPEARKDKGVLEVYAHLIARPDMSQEELQARLRKTDYWKGRSDRQREWNDLSYAEQLQRVAEEAAWLADVYWQDVGVRKSAEDKEILHYAREIAMGRTTRNWVRATWVRKIAEADPESPWSRSVRAELENRRQRGIDIENQGLALREIAHEWGVQLSDRTVAQWAKDMVEKKKSNDDFMKYIKDTAQQLYPWKDRELSTRQAAEPWLQTYERVLERPADILNGVIQKALQAGQSVYDFEIELKRRPEWLETHNASQELLSMAGDLGRRMGFE